MLGSNKQVAHQEKQNVMLKKLKLFHSSGGRAKKQKGMTRSEKYMVSHIASREGYGESRKDR